MKQGSWMRKAQKSRVAIYYEMKLEVLTFRLEIQTTRGQSHTLSLSANYSTPMVPSVPVYCHLIQEGAKERIWSTSYPRIIIIKITWYYCHISFIGQLLFQLYFLRMKIRSKGIPEKNDNSSTMICLLLVIHLMGGTVFAYPTISVTHTSKWVPCYSIRMYSCVRRIRAHILHQLMFR